jgi:Ca2+-binding RTX toxin-like protein
VYSVVDFSHHTSGAAQSLFFTATLGADGSFSLSGGGSVDGVPTQGQLSGTYTVDANGIVTVHTANSTGVTLGYISPSGQLVLAQVGSGAPDVLVGLQEGSHTSNASVAGTYAFTDFGQTGSGSSDDIQGTITLNGDGTFSDSYSANVGGTIVSNLYNSGTYSVGPDGSILGISLNQAGNFHGAISAAGDFVVAQVAAAPPEMVVGSKLGGSFSAASLAGSYVVADFSRAGSSFVSILSQVTLNADGTFSGTSAGSVNGTGETAQGGGHFTVDSNGGLVLVDGSSGTTLTGYVSATGELLLANVTSQQSANPEIIVALRVGGGGTVPVDTTPPTLVSTSPANGAVGVSVNGNLSFTFSEAIALGSGAILLEDSDGNVVASYDVASGGGGVLSVSGSTLSIHPGSALASTSAYTLVLPASAVKDLAGNTLASGGSYHFTTAGSGVTQVGTAASPSLTGTSGDDTLTAGPGNATVDGGAGNDVLLASSGNDLLMGGAGNDILIDGPGNDTLQGGDGADLYYVSNPNTVVQELATNAAEQADPNHPADAGRAVDKVIASINYTLTAFVENLSLAPAAGNLSGKGNELNNVIVGNEGNNLLTGGAGNDTIDGGAGTDTAQYSGKLADYNLVLGATTANTSTVTDKVANRDGADSLVNIERLKFADVNVALDLAPTQAAGKAVLMMAVATSLGPALATLPNLAGIFLNYFDTGASLQDGANLLVASGISAAFAGGSDNASLVKMVYADVYGKAPDAATLASLLAPLTAGTTTQAAWLASMAASADNQSHVNLTGYAGTGLQYTL